MKKLFFIIIFLIFIITGCNIKNDQNNFIKLKNDRYNHVSLVAVGDDLIHQSIYEAALIGNNKYDFKPMLQHVKPYIQEFDLKFINQETILGGKEIGLSTYPCFNSPFELGDALTDTGFNLISIANNHTLDRGELAVINSINYWNNKSVIYSGASNSFFKKNIKMFIKNNIKFAFVAYTYGTNGIPHPDGKTYLANVFSLEKAKADINEIKQLVDVIIVSMHWGTEYQNYPNKTQKEQAIFLANLGVDIIIGHHPHVIQPVELINNNNHETFVIYSLGNFLSDQQGIDRLIGMAVSVDIYKKNNNGKDIIVIENHYAKLLYRYKDFKNNKFNIKLFEDLNDEFLENYLVYFKEKRHLIQTYYPEIEVN